MKSTLFFRSSVTVMPLIAPSTLPVVMAAIIDPNDMIFSSNLMPVRFVISAKMSTSMPIFSLFLSVKSNGGKSFDMAIDRVISLFFAA